MRQFLVLILNGLRLCSAFPTTAPSPHVDLPASRTLSSFETHIFAQNHKFHFLHRIIATSSGLNIKWHSAYALFPNDTTLASCGLASFENTLAIWDVYFCPKTQIPLLCRINVTTFALNIKWYSAYVLPSQRHHPRLMWTCQLREHSRLLRHIFLPKTTNSAFVQDKCDNLCT